MQQYFIHFAPQTVPYLATGSSFHLLPVPQTYPQHYRYMLVGWLVFSTLSYFLVLQGAPGSFCVFPVPVLELASSPRSLVPLIEEQFQKPRSGHQVYSTQLLLSHFSRVRLCVTPQTAAHQAPPSLGFSRQGLGCHFLLQCMKVKSKREVTQSCPILRDPMDCSLSGSSVHVLLECYCFWPAQLPEQGNICVYTNL